MWKNMWTQVEGYVEEYEKTSEEVVWKEVEKYVEQEGGGGGVCGVCYKREAITWRGKEGRKEGREELVLNEHSLDAANSSRRDGGEEVARN
ncbi:hypothetical protein Pcinc_009431 [Petrolisthes cinctipes]|uniref:Uncharacterized protein n=1 Tax=Petrolisthes cinctipes TaxID=88211 RepID=A0AAE1FP55_PETCI|nr:hypothetical protein Pcinc_019726 [Petrolisthes cinctipes]KAK3886427.1 hypothetical protein Pcinc_009431 [Petrolisthes cinctipes]